MGSGFRCACQSERKRGRRGHAGQADAAVRLGQGARRSHADAQAGEGTGAEAHGDGTDIRPARRSRLEHLVHARQQPLRVGRTLESDGLGDDGAVGGAECRRTRRRRRLESKDHEAPHGSRSADSSATGSPNAIPSAAAPSAAARSNAAGSVQTRKTTARRPVTAARAAHPPPEVLRCRRPATRRTSPHPHRDSRPRRRGPHRRRGSCDTDRGDAGSPRRRPR